jgi:hypothetical protein
MLQGFEEMKTATRVLSALAANCDPKPADIATLRGLVPQCDDLAPDELACEVIQQVLRVRARGRAAGKRTAG